MVTRSSIAAMVLAAIAAATIPAAGAAQDRDRPGPPGANGRHRVVEIPCCTCVDGRVTTTPLNTGSAPWMVSGGAPVAASNPAWAPVSGAAWVGPTTTTSNTTYVYEIKFRVPDCVIKGKVTVTGRFAADNSAAISVDNGPVLATSLGTPNYGFQAGSITPFQSTQPIGPGTHTLTVRVSNQSGPTGVAVQANVKTECPKELEIRR